MKKRVYFGSQLRVPSLQHGKSQCQEQEAAGHIASVRRQGVMATAVELFSFVLSSGPQLMEQCSPQLRGEGSSYLS